jgi:hypothetical protein
MGGAGALKLKPLLMSATHSRCTMQFATIIARNYHAHAEVMAASLLTHHHHARLVVLIIDGTESDRETFASFGLEVALLDDLPMERDELHRMLVIYNRLEMVTAVKPRLLSWLLDRGNTTVCYLDADAVVYSHFGDIVLAAERDEIILTPHVLTPFPRDGLLPAEYTILRGGMFNLGFIAVGQGSRPFLDWWHERLTIDALFDMEAGLFTDQRWVDFVPILFGHAVCRDPGMNVAPWNVHERGITRTAGRLTTSSGLPVRFFHFSGFDPENPVQLSRHGHDRPRVVLRAEPVLASLCDEYTTALMEAGYRAWSAEPYRFDWLPNGTRVHQDARRAYRDAVVGAKDHGAPRDPLADDGAALQDWLSRLTRREKRRSR